MAITNSDLAEFLDHRFDALDAVFDGHRVVAAWLGACPECRAAGAVMMVGADGHIRARCLGELGTDYVYDENDPACHGSFEVNPDTNHWGISERGPLPDR